MLVRKNILSKKTVIMLVILIAIILPGGYFVYHYFYGSPAPKSSGESAFTSADVAVITEVSIPSFDETVFDDPQLNSLQKEEFGGFANQQEGMVLSEETPLPPKNISVTNQAVGGKLSVDWQLPVYVNFKSVRIYRSEAAGEKGDLIASLEVGAAGSHMTYFDTALDNNKVYYYLVRTLNAAGDESTNNIQHFGIPTDDRAPGQPELITVTTVGSSGDLEISWVNPEDSDFLAVRIYRSSEKGTVGSLIYEGAGLDQQGGKRHYYVDTDVEENISYYYTITSIDTNGNESTKDILTPAYNSNPFEPIIF